MTLWYYSITKFEKKILGIRTDFAVMWYRQLKDISDSLKKKIENQIKVDISLEDRKFFKKLPTLDLTELNFHPILNHFSSEIIKQGRNMSKIFSLVLSKKTCRQRKLRQTKCLLLNQKKSFGTWQFGKIDALVNFIIQKLKVNI